MGSSFGSWVKARREEMRPKVSQAEFARRVEDELLKITEQKREYTRDKHWKLELGTPANPEPELVTAIANVLRVPLREALEALGYDLPVQVGAAVAPIMGGVLATIPWDQQERLAPVLPGLLGLVQQVATGVPPAPTPEPPTPSGPPTEDQLRAARAERVIGLLTRLPDDEFEKAMQKMEEEFDPLLRRKGEPHFQVAIPKVIAS